MEKIINNLYIPENLDNQIIESCFDTNYYSVIQLNDSFIVDEIKNVLFEIKEGILKEEDINAQKINLILDLKLKQYKDDSFFSFSLFVKNEKISYFFTRGRSVVYLLRNNKSHLLLKNNSFASGYLHANDFIILTDRDSYINLNISDLFKKISINDFDLSEYLFEIKNQKFDNYICFFHVKKLGDLNVVSNDKLVNSEPIFFEKIKKSWKGYEEKISQKKIITYLILSILIVIFFRSVIFGYSIRMNDQKDKDIIKYTKLVDLNILEIENNKELDSKKTQDLINDTKKLSTELASILKDYKKEEVDKINSKISDAEKKFLKKTTKTYEEYYDLGLIKEKINFSSLNYNEGFLVIFDSKIGEIYSLNIEKKSFSSIKKAEFIGGKYVSFSNDRFFIFKDDGIITFINGKLGTSIKKDSDWGKISSMKTYNGNIYLLDEQKNNLFKYIAAEEGYGEKINYFNNIDLDFSSLVDFIIDGSIYLATNDYVYKYQSGLQEGFALSIPDQEELSIDKIYTNSDLKYFYLLDKKQNKVYVLEKNGTYLKQIVSKIFEKADDLFINEDNQAIFVIVGDKIYKVSLN